MTAEERLNEWEQKWHNRSEIKVYPARLAPQDIGLIADLVVERLALRFAKLDKAHETILGEELYND